MARELNVKRLLTTGVVAFTVATLASVTSSSVVSATTTLAAAAPKQQKGGKKGASAAADDDDDVPAAGSGRVPGTLASGAPIKMPELDSLSVVLPFSLRKDMGLTNITDVVQTFAAGAFCSGPSTAVASSSSSCDVTGEAEKVTRSKHSFHEMADNAASGSGSDAITLQHMLEATDETFLVFIYDSLDGNSYRNAAMVDEAAGMLKGYVTTVGIDSRRDDVQWLLNAWNIQLTPSLRLLKPTRMLSTTRQGLTNYDAILTTVGNSASHLMNSLNAALSPSYSLFAGTKQALDIAPNGNQMAMMRQDAWAPEAIRKFALGGAGVKSLESENTIETLTGGDKSAETVFDLLRGAHPLTFMGKEFFGNDAQKVATAAANIPFPANADSLTVGALTSPLYTRRAQVPKAIVVLFTDKDGALSNLLKGLALRYNNRAVFITVNGKEKAPKLAAAFGVTQFPTFAVVRPPQGSAGGGYKSAFDLREQLVSGAFSKTRKVDVADEGKDVFDFIADALKEKNGKEESSRLRLFTPPAGTTTLNINTVMAFMDAVPEREAATGAGAATVSLSGIIPATTLHTLQRQATRDAFHYQQVRAANLVSPIASLKDWFNNVYVHAGLVASGPAVTNPGKAPMISVGVLFTGGGADSGGDGSGVSPIIRQELTDVRGRLKDNYFVSIPKAKAMQTLAYFKQKCLLESEKKEGGAAGAISVSPTTTEMVVLYARLQPLSAAASTTATGAKLSPQAAAAAFAPNFIIDYSCRISGANDEAASDALLSSALKIDKMIHYGAKKGFAGFGGSEEAPPSFDWSEVPLPSL